MLSQLGSSTSQHGLLDDDEGCMGAPGLELQVESSRELEGGGKRAP